MTPRDADQRIILSRKTIGIYMAMIERGDFPNVTTMQLLNEEIAILEGIAEEHPGKALKIESLIEKWRKLISVMRAKLN